MADRSVTPSQTIGPFFHYGLTGRNYGVSEIVTNDLTANVDGADEHKIRIVGRLLDGGGTPIDDGLIELWQANPAGRYAHPEDQQDKPLTEGFNGFGRCATAKDGSFSFTTLKPGRVPGRGNTLQAPHICVGVFARGVLKRIITRLYFEDETAANGEDPVLESIDEARRSTLIAPREESDIPVYHFDINIQGDRETVFFDV
jgi:protocatechuate 3,4-dioxygenase, alpha subunit